MRIVLAVLCSLLLAAAGPGQVKTPCSFCKHRGFTPCKAHKSSEHAWEKGALHCSVLGDCESCVGTLQVDCPRCDNDPVQASAAQRRTALLAWRAGLRADIETITKSPGILHARSAHFDLAFSFKPMQVGRARRKRSTHELMHIYLDYLEELHAGFCKTLALTDADFAVRAEIYMFGDRKDHRAVAPRKTGGDAGYASGKKYMGDKMILSMWQHPNELKSDAAVRRYLAHHVTHLFLNHMAPHTWIYNKGHGWLDAGVAHAFEMRLSGLCTNVCYEEVDGGVSGSYKSGHWRVAVRKSIRSRKRKKLADIYTLNTDQLDSEAHALAMAYVEFLLETQGGAKLRDLIRAAKAGKPTRESLKAIYGLTPIKIEAPFQKWVLKTYPKVARSR